jgi:hypothetical protein
MRISLQRLELFMLFLLLLPVCIFVIGWLNAGTLVPVFFTLSLATYFTWRDLQNSSPKIEAEIPWSHFTSLFLIAVVWVGLSGTSGFGFQNWDHEKHNAMLFDLVRDSYPVLYPPQKELQISGSSPLVFYIGFYLFPAVLGKISNSFFSYIFLWLQLLSMVVLVFLWLTIRFKHKYALAYLLFFIFFSGNDFIGGVINSFKIPEWGSHLEWWTDWQYSAISSQLFWVPHQATIAWLGSILMLGSFRDHAPGRFFLTLTLSLLWSPYVFIGLAPFGLLFLNFRSLRLLFKEWKWEQIQIIILCLPLFFILIFYFQSKSDSIPLESVFAPMNNYLIFSVLEWAWVLPFLFYFKRKMDLSHRRLFRINMLTLALIPFAKAPGIRDFVMRASLPSIFLLVYLLIEVFQKAAFKTAKEKALGWSCCLFLITTGVTPSFEMIRSIKNYSIHIPELENKDQVPLLRPEDVAKQYLGRIDSLFFRYFSKYSHSSK